MYVQVMEGWHTTYLYHLSDLYVYLSSYSLSNQL